MSETPDGQRAGSKPKTLLAALALAVALAAPAGAETPPEGARAEAQALIKQFAGKLQGALKGAIETGGFENAIGVCKNEAPKIAADVSAGSGWRIGRTALRVRNPANAPAPDERAVLEAFLARASGGEDLTKMDREWVEDASGRRTYRYMKAIPLGELCASCHGTDIEPNLAAKIQAAYPQDQATGFAVGTLRGAFTLAKPLD
jgi:hypothetical protein